MREFIIFAHTASLTPSFQLADLPGKAGRLDVLCRCVTAALLTSHEMRTDVRLLVVIQDQYTIRFEGSDLLRLNPDERSTGSLFKNAMERAPIAERNGEQESTPGVFVTPEDQQEVIEDAADRGQLLTLHESGDPVTDLNVPDHPIFVLSDQEPFEEHEQQLLAEQGAESITLGPISLQGQQAITIAHHYLDTNGYQTMESNGNGT